MNNEKDSAVCRNGTCPLGPRDAGFCFFDISDANARGPVLRRHIHNAMTSRNSKCNIVIVTHGKLDFDSQAQAVAGGAKGIVSDHDKGERLIQAVNAVMRGEIWADRKIAGAAIRELLKSAHVGGMDTAAIESLTPREKEVASMLRHALPTAEIASRLNISRATVKTHVGRIYQKLDISNRNQLLLTLQSAES